jgi:WD40 repeat protein
MFNSKPLNIQHLLVVALTLTAITFGFIPSATQTIDDQIVALEWNGTGSHLALLYYDGQIEVFDASSNQVIRQFSAEIGTLVEWHPTQPDVLAVVTSQAEIEIWNLTQNIQLHTLSASHRITALAWSPAADILVYATSTGMGIADRSTIHIWNVTTATETMSY